MNWTIVFLVEVVGGIVRELTENPTCSKILWSFPYDYEHKLIKLQRTIE